MDGCPHLVEGRWSPVFVKDSRPLCLAQFSVKGVATD